jgi:hypothetical protein
MKLKSHFVSFLKNDSIQSLFHDIKYCFSGMDVRKTGWEGVDWMHLAAQDKDQCRAFENTVMNLRVP